MIDPMEEYESLALRLRLKFELGVLTQSEIKKIADQWSPELRAKMRVLYRNSVSSVQRNPVMQEST
jgi:hypothetical protein